MLHIGQKYTNKKIVQHLNFTEVKDLIKTHKVKTGPNAKREKHFREKLTEFLSEKFQEQYENERKLHMQKIAKDKAELDGGSTTSHLNQLIHIEKQRKTNRRIKRVLKPNNKKDVIHVLVPARSEYKNKPDDFDHYNVDEMWDLIDPSNGKNVRNWETITNKEQMEKIMTNWQRRHFMQENETPLATLPWKDKFDSPLFQQAVLDGSYTPPLDLPNETREVLMHLKKTKK